MEFATGRLGLSEGGDWRGLGGSVTGGDGDLRANQTLRAAVDAQLLSAGDAPLHDSELELNLMFVRGVAAPDAPEGEDLVIRVPLSSSTDAYGESRSCRVLDHGRIHFDYRAGLDEQNYVSFAKMDSSRNFGFLVNKYLCRALAAPFACAGEKGKPKRPLPGVMSEWKLRTADVVLHSDTSAAKALVSKLTVSSSGEAFDYGACEEIAPSNGICCVAHKTTAWHCGGKPEGAGWQQVSGDCFHRETGGSCKE